MWIFAINKKKGCVRHFDAEAGGLHLHFEKNSAQLAISHVCIVLQ